MKKKILIILLIIFLLLASATILAFWYINKIKTEGIKITLIGGSNEKDKGDINSAGYIIRTKNNKLIIVDGGRDIDADLILSYINKYGNGTVDYWYITHAHEDHVGAFLELIENESINIENICYHFNTAEWYENYDKRGYETALAMINALESSKIKNKIDCTSSQIIEMDNISCKILRIANPEIIHSDNGNEASMVFKFNVTDVNKSILFLGDSYVYTSKELLENCKDDLKSYAVQMAHHGQNGVSKEVYEAINPKICFFNCPEWLWNNDNGNGYNSGTWQTIEVRNWLENLGTTNFVAYNGDQTIRLTSKGFEILENN